MANNKTTNDLSAPTWIAIVLTVIGALNWGLVGLFRFDLVAAIFGTMSVVSRIIYVAVALAGVYLITVAPRLRPERRDMTTTRPTGTTKRVPT